ncbi:MAG: hypothetical protein U0414_08145 [Polyangiaceae bacterium]
MSTRTRCVAAALSTAIALLAKEARAEELPPTTPHPALVAGVGELITASALIGTSIWGFAEDVPDFGVALLTPGLALGIQGAISTAHGVLDRRALRSPAAASAGHVLAAFGVATGVLGASVLIRDAVDPPREFGYGALVGVPSLVVSGLTLGVGLPLLIIGEFDPARPGSARGRGWDLAPRMTVVGGPGRIALAGWF